MNRLIPLHTQRILGVAILVGLGVAVQPTTGAGWSTGLKLGTLGAGVELAAAPLPSLGLRAGFNYATWKQTVLLDDANVEGRLRWQTIPLLVDWFPGRGGFRLSAGMMINGNRVDLSVSPYDTIEMSGDEYVLESLDGSIRFADTAPYLGIGFGNPTGDPKHWYFSWNLGVLFHGRPIIRAQATAADPRMQDEVDRALREEVESLEDELRSFRLYPVLSIGFSRRF